MSKFLKVKIKSLAAEAAIIRKEEQRSHGQLRNELHNHRVVIVRKASRLALIAYAIMRNRAPADSMRNLSDGDINDIARMVRRYDTRARLGVAEELQILRAAGSIPAERAA